MYMLYTMNILFDIIFLAPSSKIYTYDLTLCDMLCDYSHISLHCPRKRKEKEIKIKLN